MKHSVLLIIIGLLAAAPTMAAYEYSGKFGSLGAAAGQFDAPRGVTIDNAGRIVISDANNSRMQICTYEGSCAAWGSFGVESGQFDKPRGVTVNATGRIFIADRGNDRVEDCSASGICVDFGGSGTAVGQFESPRDVEMTLDGRVVVSDTDNHRVQICTTAGACSAFGSAGSQLRQFNEPTGVAVDSAGRIIVADRLNHRIQVCTANGSSCTAFGSQGSAPGQFDSPTDVAVDSKDNIVVVDRFNDRVQVCTRQGACTAFGGTGSGNGQFNLPWGVAVDSQDRIIVADGDNNRIQIFTDPAATTPVSIGSLTAVPATVDAGNSTLISWSVSNATSCTPSGGTAAWRNASINPAGGSLDVTMETAGDYLFTLQCSNANSNASKSVTVTVNAVQAQILINAGMNDAWFNPATSGQGFFVNVFPDLGTMFVAWFTFDAERPPQDVTALFGEPGHRWMTAYGPYNGNTAELDIEFTYNGVLGETLPPGSQSNVGTFTLVWENCNKAVFSYDIPSLGLSGDVPVERIVLDNVPLCESLGYPQP